jgi:hypothetical protein
MEKAGYQEAARHRLFNRATVTLVVVAGLAWLVISLMCLAMGFESSEYEKTDERWWHDLYSCVPVWLSFVGFTSVSAISLHYRSRGIAFFLAVISLGLLWAFFPGPIRVMIAAISTVVTAVSIASYIFRGH